MIATLFPELIGSDQLLVGLLVVAAKTTVLLLLAWFALRLMSKAPATVRHAVWVVAFGGALVLPLAELAAPTWNVLPALADARPAAAGVTRVSRQAVPSGPDHADAAVFARSAGTVRSAPTATTAREPAGSGSITSRPAGISWSTVALSTWAAGVAFLLGRMLLGSWQIGRLKAHAADVPSDEQWQDALRRARRSTGLSSHVAVRIADQPAVPLVVGLRRPVVLLPQEANDWSEVRKTSVLAHEFAHIVRADLETDLMARVICIVYWFNPLVWLALRRMHFERERACDDAVLSTGANPADYASQILSVAAAMRGANARSIAAAMARPSELEGRLLSILDRRRCRRRATRFEVAAALGIAMLVLGPIAAVSPTPKAVAADSAALTTATDRDRDPQGTSSTERTANWSVDDFVRALQSADEEQRELAERSLQALDAGDLLVGGVIDRLVVGLDSEVPRDRHATLWQLAKTRSPRVLDLLVRCLDDDDVLVRKGAAGALGELGDPRAVPHLARLVDDDDAVVRTWAVRALGNFSIPGVVDAVRAFVDDPDPLPRQWVARALGSIADPAGADTLMFLIRDDNSAVREWAVRSFNSIEDGRVVEVLIEALRDNGSNVREWAARTLMTYEDPRSVGPLMSALSDPDPDVREWSARALGSLADPDATEALGRAVFDPKPHVREWAVRALNSINDPRAVNPLIEALQDDHGTVREWAIRSLMSYNEPRIVKGLIESLTDTEHDVREWSARALGHLGDPAAIYPLEQAASDPITDVRDWATRALAEIDDPAAVEVLTRLVESAHLEVQFWAVRGLGAHGTPAARDALQETLIDVRISAAARAQAALALGRLQEQSAVEALLQVLGDDSDELRKEASTALGRIGAVVARQALSELADRDPAAAVRRAAAEALKDLMKTTAPDAEE